MKIAVYANDASWNELILTNPLVAWKRVNSPDELFGTSDSDAMFNLAGEHAGSNKTGKPYFVSSVITPLRDFPDSNNIIRFNGWSGFLLNNTWEICGAITEDAKTVLSFLQKQFIEVSDEPGLISARIISMIINEAFFAEGEQVSKPKEIDIAMKLGTNYPHGPFEWAEMIGLKNVYLLLKKLSQKDPRYTIAPLLEQKING